MATFEVLLDFLSVPEGVGDGGVDVRDLEGLIQGDLLGGRATPVRRQDRIQRDPGPANAGEAISVPTQGNGLGLR